MKLPHGDQAVIDPRKLTEYSLNTQHEDGKDKAYLFDTLLGLNSDNFTLLLDALQVAASTGEATPGKLDRYGQRFVVDFEFLGPAGNATVRSAWIIRQGETVPRLVTGYIL